MSSKITITLSGDMKDHLDILKDAYKEMMNRYKKLAEQKDAQGSDSDEQLSYVVITIEDNSQSPVEDTVEDNDEAEALDLASLLHRLSRSAWLPDDFLSSPEEAEKSARDSTYCPFCTSAGNCAEGGSMESCLINPSRRTAKAATAPCCDNCPKEEKAEDEPKAEVPLSKGADDIFDPIFLFEGVRNLFPGINIVGLPGQGKTASPEHDKAPAAEKPEAEGNPQKVEDEVEKVIEDLTEVARVGAVTALRHARKLTDFLKNLDSK